MVDLDILQEKGCTPEKLKEWFQGDPREYKQITDDEKKRWKLWNRIRSRVQEGMDRNFKDWKTWYALDQAWDTPFRQISPTLLQSFIDQDPNEETIYKQFQDWGLTNFITQETDKRTGQPTGKKAFNLPIFFNVFVPLVRAYVTIRWAKIINDRRLTPLFKYEPAKATAVYRAKCETITDRIEIMSNQYNYFEVLKQGVLKMLHYGQCFMVPREEWHREETWKVADAEDVAFKKRRPAKDGEENSDKEGMVPVSVGDELKVTEKEGLRYYHPHPTRFYYDLAHGPYTYNTDTGCEFFGYWRVARYREVTAGEWWNKDAVSLGTADLLVNNRLFFLSTYSACTMKMGCAATQPQTPDGAVPAATAGVGTGQMDREKEIANQYYGTDHEDQGVLLTEHFEKLVPSECGMGDYDCPVWFRFVMGGDGYTVLYAAPLPGSPVLYAGYDADESRTKPASLSLETLPFQDQFTNVLNQIILTAKQNLANLTLVDEDQIPEDSKAKLMGIGENLYRYLNVFGYSGKKAFRGQNKIAEAVQSFNLPKGSVGELINVLKTILDVLERVLVMSSHEVAQAASHEQTREEVKNIAQSTSSRLTFTATPVDIMIGAMKRQLYTFTMANGDDDMYAHIPSETPLTQEQIEALGFTFVDRDDWKKPGMKYYRMRVKKDSTAMNVWEFSSKREGEDRINDREVAIAMSQLVQNLMNNPMTAQAIGPEQAIDLANAIAQKAGLDRDFKLKNMAPEASQEQQQAQAQQQLQQVTQEILKTVQTEMQDELKPMLDTLKEAMTEGKQNTKDINHLQDTIMNVLAERNRAPQMAGAGNGA